MRLAVDCLFLRSPSLVPYRTELIPSRSLGWRIHESVEDTKLSTNKQHSVQFRIQVSLKSHPTVRARKCRPLRVRIPKKHRRVPIFENIFWGHFRKQPQFRGKPSHQTCRAPAGCGGYSSSTVGFHGLATRLPAYPSASRARGKKR